MKKIGWIEILSRKYGGRVYEQEAKKALAANFDFELKLVGTDPNKKGYFRAPDILFSLLKLKGGKDILIRDVYTLLTLGWDKLKGKNLVLIHHIDFSQSSGLGRAFDYFIERLTYWKLRRADFIVTVSEYWKNHFLQRGFKNVYKIYNSFDLASYQITDQEVLEFKKKHKLEGKPIIYLGNCQADKGVKESYEALKDLDAFLVTSGEKFIEIPAKNLQVEYREYLKLLKASSLVIFMSKIKEGWGRTAHEALLLKTPVVGSGLGGSKELLEGAKQIVCPDFKKLKEKVEHLLKNPEARKQMGQDGYNFAKEFTAEKFAKDWVNLIKDLK